MTVCLGAVCCDHTKKAQRAVVVASDRMVTMGQITEFEHEVPKLTHLTPRTVSLMAGDALRGSKLTRELSQALLSSGAMPVPQVAQSAADMYSVLRLTQLNDEIFRPRGMNVHTFYSGGQTQLVPQLALGLDNLASGYNYNVELLVAGSDDAGGHLYYVGNPGGTATPFHHTGFAAIGSGQLHAVQSLIGFAQAPNKGLPETIFNVYASKRRAEAAPGVGKETDMAIIHDDGIVTIHPDVLSQLGSIYDAYQKPIGDETLDAVRKLQFIVPDSPTAITS